MIRKWKWSLLTLYRAYGVYQTIRRSELGPMVAITMSQD